MNISTSKSGPDCTLNIKELNLFAEELINNEYIKKAFKGQFKNGNKLTDDELLYMFADIFVGLVQYGERTRLCDMLKGLNLTD